MTPEDEVWTIGAGGKLIPVPKEIYEDRVQRGVYGRDAAVSMQRRLNERGRRQARAQVASARLKN